MHSDARAHDINHYFGEEATSEDCLYLNVWARRAARRATARHGLDLRRRLHDRLGLDGELRRRAARAEGRRLVTIAYRVGALGFMAHPELTAESPQHASGNYGFLDQIAALQWIQRNIARFGGDPGNVTIMGQSAGSSSVSLLQASPLVDGFFHRAVGMSGGAVGANGSARPLLPPSSRRELRTS